MRKFLIRSVSVIIFVVTAITPLFTDSFFYCAIKAGAAYESTSSSYNYPIRSVATTGRGFYSAHKAVDLSTAKGTAVYSSKKGEVVEIHTGCKNYNGANKSSGKDCTVIGCSPKKTDKNGTVSVKKIQMTSSDGAYRSGYYCSSGLGNGVVIKNDDGKYCYYGHLNSVSVKVGDKVTPDTKIGEVGSSGCSTGAHLHFSVKKDLNGSTVYNPFNYIFPGFKITLTNNGSGSVNPQFKITFPWKDFEAERCEINFGTSASSLNKKAYDTDINTSACFYDLGKKFGNLTTGKTYYIKVVVTKNDAKHTSPVYSFVAGSGNKIFLDYASVINQDVVVTFNGNGGTPSVASAKFEAGKIYGDTMPSAVRDGYTFEGWYTSATGGTKVTRSTNVTAGNKTLYARWSANQTDALRVGGVYRIYNENSGLVLAATGDANGSAIVQVKKESAGNRELWRVTEISENGYYRFESLGGGRVWDVDAAKKWNFGAVLQVIDRKDNNAQRFSVVRRGNKTGYSGLYSIHCKNSGRAMDVSDSSKEPGAKIVQWEYHGGANQLFYFEEHIGRKIEFYDNHNNSYIPSPLEEYEQNNSYVTSSNYQSRNTEYVKVMLKPENNTIVIDALKVGSSGKDMNFITSLNGSYNYEFAEVNADTMVLKFRARSTVAGAKIHFRWGYENVFFPVQLTTDWQYYTVELPRTKSSGACLHPYVDKVCKIEMSDIALYDKNADAFSGETDYFSSQILIGYVNDTTSLKAPLPAKTKPGYVFDGWYTRRSGGIKVADGGDYYDVSSLSGTQRLYAHWVKKLPEKAPAPTKITAAQNTSAIKLSWNVCPGATGYRIYYKSGSSWKVCVSSTVVTSHTFKNLKPGAKYTFAIRPYILVDGTVIWSDYTEFTTATKPDIPVSKATSPSKGKISLTFRAVNGADGYQVYYKTGNGAYKLYKTYTKTGTLNFSKLKSGTKYTFAVRAGIRTSGGVVWSGYKEAPVTVK